MGQYRGTSAIYDQAAQRSGSDGRVADKTADAPAMRKLLPYLLKLAKLPRLVDIICDGRRHRDLQQVRPGIGGIGGISG